MYDVVHASIANERVRDLIEDAAVQRARRDARRDSKPATSEPAAVTPRATRRLGLRSLRPRLR